MDECTNALTGVGAAIAEGSQDEKGICALFVIEVSKRTTRMKWKADPRWLEKRESPRIIRRKQSPKRLVKAVIMPDPKDLRFL